MDKHEIQAQALANARNGQSFSNYGAIYEGFGAMGIAESDILPRENVFTYHAWRALGRQVRKGEHGVKVATYVPMEKRVQDDSGSEKVEAFRAPRMTTVFHVSQTDAIDGAQQQAKPESKPEPVAERKTAEQQGFTVGGYYSDEFTPIN